MNDRKLAIRQELQPFGTPDYVSVKTEPGSRTQGIKWAPKFHLSELSDETLSELCDQFRRDVFAKAGRGPDVEYVVEIGPEHFVSKSTGEGMARCQYCSGIGYIWSGGSESND